MIAELDALDVPATDPAMVRAKAIIDTFRTSPEQLNRGSLLELEQTLLSLQPTETLLQRAPVLRLRYREVVGERQYGVYQPADLNKCNGSDTAIRKSLLGDLKTLASGIHWRYVLGPQLDSVQTHLTIRVVRWVLTYTVLWALALLITGRWLHIPFIAVLATVLYAGILGGYVSSLRRMQSINSEDADSLMVIQAVQNSSYFLWLSPLIGALFAVVLLLIFIANLVGGTVFPSFHAIPPDSKIAYPENWPFLFRLLPMASLDYAKLFLWSFIAGFAERFVPDMLDRIIQRGQETKDAAGGIPPVQKLPPAPPSQPAAAGAEPAPESAAPAPGQGLAAVPVAAQNQPADPAAVPPAPAEEANAPDAADAGKGNS
uniref:Uncharacterized protein n=2 Tax=Paracidobacterium acidisoli TaxID=2303751 RepID=A0A372IL49_9BACT